VLLRLGQQLPAALNLLRQELAQLPGHGGPPIVRTRFLSCERSTAATSAYSRCTSAKKAGNKGSHTAGNHTARPVRPLRPLATLRPERAPESRTLLVACEPFAANTLASATPGRTLCTQVPVNGLEMTK
jgi:hypothetical protein